MERFLHKQPKAFDAESECPVSDQSQDQAPEHE